MRYFVIAGDNEFSEAENTLFRYNWLLFRYCWLSCRAFRYPTLKRNNESLFPQDPIVFVIRG